MSFVGSCAQPFKGEQFLYFFLQNTNSLCSARNGMSQKKLFSPGFATVFLLVVA